MTNSVTDAADTAANDAAREAERVAARAIATDAATAVPARPEAGSEADMEDPNGGGGQARLEERAAADPRAPGSAPETAPSPERRAAIDAFVAGESEAVDRMLIIFTDAAGGERVGAALKGDSVLGTLTDGEKAYLAGGATEVWARAGGGENVTDAAVSVASDPAAAAALALALARQSAAMDADAGDAMIDAALTLDPVRAVEGAAGAEARVARVAMDMGRSTQALLLDALATRRIDGTAGDRLASAMFVHARASDLEPRFFEGNDATTQRAFADALAMTAHPGTAPADAAQRRIVSDRLAGALGAEGGRDLLLGEAVNPDVRAWALGRVMTDPTFDARAVSRGWESDAVTIAFGEETAARHAGRAGASDVLAGAALRNTVGTALGLPPVHDPAGETPAAREARLVAGLDHDYYGEGGHAAAVADAIETLGGPGARVAVIPVAVTSNEFGVAAFNVFRVERQDGSVGFVDHEGQRYRNLAHWEAKNELPPGRMVRPEGMEPGATMTGPENTRAVVDSGWEYAGRALDWTATGVGVVAGAAIVVGTGGTAALVAAGGAGLYAAGRAGSDLYDEAQRGNDVLDMSDPGNRSRWLEVAAGTLSVGAIGGGLRVANAMRSSAQVGQGMNAATKGLAIAADVADLAAVADQTQMMARNWADLSAGDRAAGMLNIAFWGGMTAASSAANGIGGRDVADFGRMQRLFETGTPYRTVETPGMAPGDIRVRYADADGAPLDQPVIEVGPGAVDPAALLRHTDTARGIERAGGLGDRLTGLLGGARPEPGTAAWEAELEIAKIGDEAAAIADARARGGLTPDATAALDVRQSELDEALTWHAARLNDAAASPQGFVAGESIGRQQAEGLGWPVDGDLPGGYHWRRGTDGIPSLVAGTGVAAKDYDPVTGDFIDRPVHVSDGKASRLPRSNGHWDGVPGNSDWHSDHPRVRSVVGDEPIPFRGGRPDFSAWSEGTVTLAPGVLNGSDADFPAIYRQVAEDMGLPNQTAASRWLTQEGLTPHHLSDTEILLIPTDLHGNIPHIGSASEMRRAAAGGLGNGN